MFPKNYSNIGSEMVSSYPAAAGGQQSWPPVCVWSSISRRTTIIVGSYAMTKNGIYHTTKAGKHVRNTIQIYCHECCIIHVLLFLYVIIFRAFDVEMLYLAQSLGIPIDEVAVEWNEIEGLYVIPDMICNSQLLQFFNTVVHWIAVVLVHNLRKTYLSTIHKLLKHKCLMSLMLVGLLQVQ